MGWTAGPRPARQADGVSGALVRPLEVDGPGTQQRRDDRHRFLEAAGAVVKRVAVGGELRFVPAGAEGEDQAAAADLVEGVGDLGEERGVAEGRAEHDRAKFHAGGRHGSARGRSNPPRHLRGPTKSGNR